MKKENVCKKFKEALSTPNVYICYQPQYNHITGRMIGAEALIRWHDDLDGDQSPSNFIPILEKGNLIHEADLHVFELICIFLRKCLDLGVPVVPISFNISRYDILEYNYVEEIETIRKYYNIPTKYLRAEITESSAIGGTELVNKLLDDLHVYGYIVEMDDFGNGYSSLNILKDLPVDVIKLDMRFLKGHVEGRGGAIINSIAQMSRWLNTPLIAEGVETVNQADFMKSLGCNYIQGYLYAKPLKEDDFVNLLKKSAIESFSSVMDTKDLIEVHKFLDPDSIETTFFNSFAGPAVICILYEGGYLDVIRANDKYFNELGIDCHSLDSIKDIYREENTRLFFEAIARCVESGREEQCDTWIQVENKICKEYKDVCVRNYISVLGHLDDKYVLYVNIRNITKEVKEFKELEESESKFKYASEHTNTYSWEYNIVTKEMKPCSRCRRDLCLPALIENYPEPLFGTIFPWDYADLYRDWMKQLEEGAKHLEGVIPLTKDRIPFKVEYTTIFDEGGRPYKAYGSATIIGDNSASSQVISDMAYTLAKAHVAVYEISLKSEDFVVFYASKENGRIVGNVNEGKDFFKFISGVVYPNISKEEKESFKAEFTKDYICNILNSSGNYQKVFKITLGNKVKYLQIKASYIGSTSERILIIVDDITDAISDQKVQVMP